MIAVIGPFNFPGHLPNGHIVPALLTGNTVIFKPSRLGCASIMRLAQLIEGIGLPQGVLNIVPTTDYAAAQELVKSQLVDMISFTGGTETGQTLMKLASETTKKVSLELGGKSPNIIFADCEMDAALGGTMSAIFMNQGQMCTAGSRLLLEDKIYDEFLEKLVIKADVLSTSE